MSLSVGCVLWSIREVSRLYDGGDSFVEVLSLWDL